MSYAIEHIEPVKSPDKAELPFADCLPGNGFVVPLADYSMPTIRARAIQAGHRLGRRFQIETRADATAVYCVGYCDPRPRQRRKLADLPAPAVVLEPAAQAPAAEPAPALVMPVLPSGAKGWGDAPRNEPAKNGACLKCGSFHALDWPCLFE